jgi:hypothetical protein
VPIQLELEISLRTRLYDASGMVQNGNRLLVPTSTMPYIPLVPGRLAVFPHVI